MIPQEKKKSSTAYWWQNDDNPTCNTPAPQPGDTCPECAQGILDYDSMFLLICPTCKKIAAGGAFT